ncbi:hypothetical protein CH063_08652, partial [Colletotrichum higginsianum]
RVVQRHVPREDVLDVLELAGELPDGPHGDAGAAEELAVVDADVARVGLDGDRVVPVRHDPPPEGDVVRVHRVRAVRVERVVLRGGCAVHVHVLEHEVLRVHDVHRPHLALDEPEPPDDRVREAPEVDVHRPPGHVGSPLVQVVPHLTVAVQSPDPVAFPHHAVAAKVPDRALVLEPHGHRHGEPVAGVVAPEQLAALVDDHVVQLGGHHGRLDVVDRTRQHDDAPGPAPVVQRGEQRRRIVPAVGVRLENAQPPALPPCSLGPGAGARDVRIRHRDTRVDRGPRDVQSEGEACA